MGNGLRRKLHFKLSQTPLPPHPAHNAALAVACTHRLLGASVALDRLAVAARHGIERTRLPARLEVLAEKP